MRGRESVRCDDLDSPRIPDAATRTIPCRVPTEPCVGVIGPRLKWSDYDAVPVLGNPSPDIRILVLPPAVIEVRECLHVFEALEQRHATVAMKLHSIPVPIGLGVRLHASCAAVREPVVRPIDGNPQSVRLPVRIRTRVAGPQLPESGPGKVR